MKFSSTAPNCARTAGASAAKRKYGRNSSENEHHDLRHKEMPGDKKGRALFQGEADRRAVPRRVRQAIDRRRAAQYRGRTFDVRSCRYRIEGVFLARASRTWTTTPSRNCSPTTRSSSLRLSASTGSRTSGRRRRILPRFAVERGSAAAGHGSGYASLRSIRLLPLPTGPCSRSRLRFAQSLPALRGRCPRAARFLP